MSDDNIAERLRALEKEMATTKVASDYNNIVGNTLNSIGHSTPVRYGLSKLGQLLDVLDTGENLVTLGLRPLVTSYRPDLENVYKRYEKDTGFLGVPNITPSALIEEAIPGRSIYKGILKFSADVLADPLTYVTFGTRTAAGVALSKVKGLAKTKEVIKLDSKLASEIAGLYGEARPTVNLIRRAKQEAIIPKTLAEQARAGERGLVNLNIPGVTNIALIKGGKFFGQLDEARTFVRANKYGSAFNKVFSNRSGIPEFDQIRQEFINLMRYRKGEVIASAKAIDDQLDNIASKLGIPREQVDKIATELVEKPSLTRRITKKVVTRLAPEGTELKQRLVNVLRAMGESKAADFWEKQSIFSKQFRDIANEAKSPTSPVAKFLEGGTVYENLKSELDPIKRMVDDINDWNASKPGKKNFLSSIGELNIPDSEIPPWFSNLDNWEVNPVSKLILRAYKEKPDAGPLEIGEHLANIVNDELLLNRKTNEEVFKDLFRLIENKPSKPIKSGTVALSKLDRELKEIKSLTSENLLAYYQSHFFRPQRAITGDFLQSADIQAARAGYGSESQFKLLRKGQLADILKQNRGDVYDRMAFLINEGLIENRKLLPPAILKEILDKRVIYDEQEVLVKEVLIQKSPLKSFQKYQIIPRSQFEEGIAKAKKLIYDTKQILPIVHGTDVGNIQNILKSGLLSAESIGSGTQARDYTVGLKNTVFASAPKTIFGDTKIILPVSFLEKASALPEDGLYLPANKMITDYLLTRGQDGIVDLLLRTLALRNWDFFQGDFITGLVEHPDIKTRFATQLDRMNIQPDIHLTAPISPKEFLNVLGPEDWQIPRTYHDLTKNGVDVEKMQLIQKGSKYLAQFNDKAGNPIFEQELLATPNLAEAISRANIVGVGTNAEKQAAALEQFIQKSNIPQGESIFTYLRKTQPQLFAGPVKVGDSDAFNQILDNYGLLSDKSMDAIAANILDIREGAYGKGLSARQILASPLGVGLNKQIVINQDNFEKAINKIPGYTNMPLEEKGKLARMMLKQVKAHERGHDIFVMGMRVLPQEIQDEFVDIAAKATQVDLLKVGKQTIKERKLSGMLKAYMNDGEDGAIKYLMGEGGLRATKKFSENYEFMKSVVLKLVSHADEMFSEAHSLYMINSKGLQRRWPEAFGVMRKIYQRKGWKTDWIIENTQIPRKLAQKYPDIVDIANKVRSIENEYLEREVDAGVKSKVFTGDIEYTRHVITKEVRDMLQKKLFRGARVWSDQHQAQIMRKFRNIVPQRLDNAVQEGWLTQAQASKLRKKSGLEYLDILVEEGKLSKEKANGLIHWLTVDEVNALGRAGKLKILGGESVPRFFEDNPAQQIKVRGIEGERARTSAEFFQASKQFGVFQKQPQQGYKFVKPESLAGWQFPEEIAEHIDRYYETIKMPLSVHPFLDAFDNIQDIWKAWTLAIFPAYHTRNIVGNVWNNFLAGLVNPGYYSQARNILQLLPTSIKTGYGKTFTTNEIIDLAKQHNIWRIGQYTGDIEQLFEREVSKASRLAKLRDNSILQTGRNIGAYLETNSYLAHFVWRLEQGYSPAAAAQSVKKYLFDYSDLTDFEKTVMKRVFPFYTWTRKNIPLQLEALATQPRKPLGILKAKAAIESTQDGVPDERYLPDWMTQNFPIRVRKDDKTGHYEYFLLGSWLPLADIDKLFRPDRLVTNMLTPLLKEPMQQLLNKDVFFGKEIDQGGEYERLIGVNMPKRLSHLLKNIRALNEADKLTKGDLSTEAKIVGLVTGKLYPFDVKKERKYRKNKEMEQDRNLQGQLNRAQKKHDKGEVERVLKLIKKVHRERKQFKQES